MVFYKVLSIDRSFKYISNYTGFIFFKYIYCKIWNTKSICFWPNCFLLYINYPLVYSLQKCIIIYLSTNIYFLTHLRVKYL